MNRNNFRNKVVLVSGSSRGIGKAIARELLLRDASVVINGRDKNQLELAERELDEHRENLLAIRGDVTELQDALMILRETLNRFGRLDILINGAGISMRGKFESLDPGVFRSVFLTNVIGVTNLSIPAMPHIKKSGGSIVFISSLAGIRGLPGLSAYSSSKMALRGIAESMRVEEAGSGIHIGLIQIGQTETENGKKIMQADGQMTGLEKRTGKKISSLDTVVRATLKNIEQRKFITTLTRLGKLNALVNRVAPWLGDKILIRNSDQFLEAYQEMPKNIPAKQVYLGVD